MDQLANFIAISCVVQYAWSYYWNCYRKGYSMDIWHFTMLFNVIIIHIMLPFSRSDLNVFALGPGLLRRTQDHVTEAYLISAFGYMGIFLGGSLWRVRLGLGLRSTFSRWAELPARGSLLLLRSRSLLILHGLVAAAILAGVVLYYFSIAGFGFNVRGLLLVMPAFRPIAQFAAFYSVLIASYCLVRFSLYKDWWMLAIILLITVGLLFFGERSNLLAIVMLTIVGTFIRLGRRIKVGWIVLAAFAAPCVAFLLDALRSSNFSLRSILQGFVISTFYGNSFSDTRDFAVVLSFWDGHYFLGKTYAAGLIAFVPRAFSTFRDKWAIGVVTATMAGFNTQEHPGLRMGIFGEAYLNFGLVGVLLLSVSIGSILRLVDMRMKQSVALLPKSDVRLFSYSLMFVIVSVMENSSGASNAYSILLIVIVSWTIQRAARSLKLAL